MLDLAPDANENVDAERHRLNHERLRFERQKLAIEVRLKRRELLQSHEYTFKDLLANPFILAIVGGFLTIMTSICDIKFGKTKPRGRRTVGAPGRRYREGQPVFPKMIVGPRKRWKPISSRSS